MIQRPENGEASPETKVYGFLCGVELEDGLYPEEIANKLCDAVRFIEGVGDVTVDLLGEVEFVEETETTVGEWANSPTKES